MVVGRALAAGVEASAAPASAGDVTVSALGTEPAGLSAISFTSSEVRTSAMAAERDWTRIVAGPWKCRKSLSPQIVRLAHVLNVKLASLVKLHTALSRIVRQNLVSGSHVRGLGICKRRLLDLKR